MSIYKIEINTNIYYCYYSFHTYSDKLIRRSVWQREIIIIIKKRQEYKMISRNKSEFKKYCEFQHIENDKYLV